MEAHYRPNWVLTQAHGLRAYNCGYADGRGSGSFDQHQRELVWRLLGDTGIDAASTVLDVGCGIGGPAGWIFERHRPGRLIGIEYLDSSVHAADRRWRGQADRPVFVQGDGHKLPIDGASVDVIFNLESALHYADKDAFLIECRRVLKPGGTLCIGDITTPRKMLFAPIRLLNRLPSQFNSNVYLWSSRDYSAALRRNGFDVLDHENASGRVADSLADGLKEVRSRGWRESRGFRGRIMLLDVIRRLLTLGLMQYDLFRARRPVSTGQVKRETGAAPRAASAIPA